MSEATPRTEAQDRGRQPSWRRRMVARNPQEPDRASTPLELFFDLCFVVAVAQAASELHHSLAEGHFSKTEKVQCTVLVDQSAT